MSHHRRSAVVVVSLRSAGSSSRSRSRSRSRAAAAAGAAAAASSRFPVVSRRRSGRECRPGARHTRRRSRKITADPGAIARPACSAAPDRPSSRFPSRAAARPSVCCSGGSAIPNCGPVDIDLSEHPGDLPRLVLAPQNTASPNGEVQVTVRARVKTVDPLQVTIAGLLTCDVAVDTTQGSSTDLVIAAPLDSRPGRDRRARRRSRSARPRSPGSSPPITRSAATGCATSPACTSRRRRSRASSARRSRARCKARSTGSASRARRSPTAAASATACTGGQCMEGSACLQETGLDGLLPASSLFASFSPSTTGGLEMYEVAGGYSTTADSGATGISLGLLGGMEPGGSARDMCGPPATEPAPVSDAAVDVLRGQHAARHRRGVRRRHRPPQVAARRSSRTPATRAACSA